MSAAQRGDYGLNRERVTAQRFRKRWAYVIHGDGWPFVSAARYGSADAALRAGQADAAQCAAHELDSDTELAP